MAIDKKFIVKNGLTTQNISFVNNVVASTSNIEVSMLSSNTLSFSGTSGQLFSITDSMTGTIFSVNDISGIPSIEVIDDGRIYLAETFGNVAIGSNNAFGNKLRVSGDVRIDSNLYVGANAYIEGNITSVDRVQMNVSSPATVGGAGQLAWNIDENTLDIGMNANTTLQVGQEQYFYVKNQTGNTIPNRTVVMAAGTVGSSGRIKVAPALANNSVPSKYIIGITTENIPDGADGFVTAFGKIRKIDTSMFSEGDILYASSSVAGGLSNTAPIAPNNIVTVAIVVSKDATNGELFVRPSFASSLFEDESTYLRNLQNDQVIAYVAANARFENKTFTVTGGDASNAWVNANDYSTLLTAQANDFSTLQAAYANDFALFSSVRTFNTFSVAGQSDVVADAFGDTLTLVAGNGMSITTNATSDTITISSIGTRTVTVADAASITVNADTTDVAYQNNTQSAGTLTINAPTGTLVDSQKFILRIKSANVQTFSWNGIFAGSTDGSLPTSTTGTSKTDYMGFIYMNEDTKWHMIAKNFGF